MFFQSEKSSQIHEEEDKIWPEEEGPPPSYDSLFGQIKEAKETSDGSFDFCKRVVQLFAGTSKIFLNPSAITVICHLISNELK